jgi:hypothetical protein
MSDASHIITVGSYVQTPGKGTSWLSGCIVPQAGHDELDRDC